MIADSDGLLGFLKRLEIDSSVGSEKRMGSVAMPFKPGTDKLGVGLIKEESVAKNLDTISGETSSTVSGAHWGLASVSLSLFLESTVVTPVSKSGLAPHWGRVIQ